MKSKDESSRKKQAFLSFLETTSSSKIQSKKNLSDHEEVYEQQYVQQSSGCNVCGEQVPESKIKKKICGFCQQVACSEHLRKRRKKKNKYERICDNCQDKYLYDFYMKLEIKAEESLAVQQEIVTLKLEEFKQILNDKQASRRDLSFASSQIDHKYEQKMAIFSKEEARLLSLSNRLESDQLKCAQMEEYINKMENKVKANYQQDFKILTEEDNKLGSQLARVQKRCSEVRSAIQKRQKQLEQAYEEWERKQYNEGQNSGEIQKGKQKDKCAIF